MKFHLFSIGQKMPGWADTACQEYTKRLPAEYALVLTSIRLATRHKNSNIAQCILQEGKEMLARIPARSHIIALDEQGELWDTLTLSKHLAQWRLQGEAIYFLIGGPDGLSPECKAKARQIWSLSRLTLPHPLVRVVLAEQLYRASTLLSGHPYHRG